MAVLPADCQQSRDDLGDGNRIPTFLSAIHCFGDLPGGGALCLLFSAGRCFRTVAFLAVLFIEVGSKSSPLGYTSRINQLSQALVGSV